MNPLRKQMEADLAVRGMAHKTREAYLSAVAGLAKKRLINSRCQLNTNHAYRNPS